MTRAHARVARNVDAVGLDQRRNLPEDARLPRQHQVRGTAVEADESDFVRLRLNRLEQLRCNIRTRCLEHRVTVSREFRAHDVENLGTQRAPRVEDAVTARLEHALDTAVARQNRSLTVLDGHAQRQQMPSHDTSPSLPAGPWPEGGFRFQGWGDRTRLPAAATGRGLSFTHSGGGARTKTPGRS
jgi:hypothetical protein